MFASSRAIRIIYQKDNPKICTRKFLVVFPVSLSDLSVVTVPSLKVFFYGANVLEVRQLVVFRCVYELEAVAESFLNIKRP